MPKQPKKTSRPSHPHAGPSKPSSRPSTSTNVKLYSSFLPIPLTLPSPIPIPSSSSSKPVTSVTHYLYVRPHTPKPTDKDDIPGERSVFVANVPVDMGERGLRAVLSKWGVVERVIMGGKGDGDVLEDAVMGLGMDEDDDDIEEEGEGGGDQQETEENSGIRRSEPTFLGDPTLSKKKPRRRNRLPASVPSITPLPSISPRSDPYSASGLRTAHVVYLESLPVSRLMTYSGGPIPYTPSSDDSNPSGLGHYLSLHSTLRPSLPSVKVYSDTSMARFDHLHSLLLSSRAKQQGAGALVDEDGFTVVVRGGKHSRTGGISDRMGRNFGSVGVAGRGFGTDGFSGKNGKKKGNGELLDFYKFQKMDRKRQELADLRSKFEEDKKKVEEMKKTKRFKPY